MSDYRVIAFTRTEPEDRGYVGTKRVHYQELQESYISRFFKRRKWRTIDREEVPAHVRISQSCFGDAGGWMSKFSDRFSWGTDGICTPIT
jgi:hypothetical protein